MRGLLVVVVLVVIGCGGGPGATRSATTPQLTALPTAAASPTHGAKAEVCSVAQEATDALMDEIITMLETRAAGQMRATQDATTRAHEIAGETIVKLPEGNEDDRDISVFAYRVRDIQSLTVNPDWTPNQLSNAGTDLVDATAALNC